MTHPKPPENGLYDDLLHFMNVTRSRVTFLERKVINVIDLLERDDKYSRAVDPTDSWLIELDIGEKSLQEAKFKMKQALILQKRVEEAWLAYHKDHVALQSEDVIRNPLIISHWNRNFILSPNMDIEQFRLAMRGKTLHLLCCCIQGPSFYQWGQVAKHLSTMTIYRNDLRTYVPDEAVTSSRRAAAVKDGVGVAIQRRCVEEAKVSPTEQNIFIIHWSL